MKKTSTERVREWRETHPDKRGPLVAYFYGVSDTHCRRGHPRIPENISVRPNGDVRCQACERANKRFRRYGLTEEMWDVLFDSQGRACAACGSKTTDGWDWHTDHNHECCPTGHSCGKCIRGILCDRCNRALGNVGDSVEKLYALIDYLKRTSNGVIEHNCVRHDSMGEETMLQS